MKKSNEFQSVADFERFTEALGNVTTRPHPEELQYAKTAARHNRMDNIIQTAAAIIDLSLIPVVDVQNAHTEFLEKRQNELDSLPQLRTLAQIGAISNNGVALVVYPFRTK